VLAAGDENQAPAAVRHVSIQRDTLSAREVRDADVGEHYNFLLRNFTDRQLHPIEGRRELLK
jgi:hypothetical protein